MSQIALALISGMGGTAIGCLVTWILMTRAARNQARRELLVRTAEALEDYRVAYAQWYVEYLSPQARASGVSWAKPGTGKPDPAYLDLMRAVDKGRGELRVIQGALYAHFPQKVIKPLWAEIEKVLIMSADKLQADCRHVDKVVESACDLIPDMIRKYY